MRQAGLGKSEAVAFPFLLILAVPWPAHGQACGKRDEFVARLEGVYDEAPVGMGLAKNGSLVELFVSEAGTWTVMISYANGTSCLIAAGEYWSEMEHPGDGA